MLWLKTEVGLDDKVFERHDSLLELNGLTLFSYGGDDAATAFASEARVPMRMAIKILCFRDKKCEKVSNSLIKWNSKQLSEFLEEIFVEKENANVKLLCEEIIKNDIDGLIFYHYKDAKQFESDFNELNIGGLYFKKAILTRNAKFNIPTTCSYPLFCDDNMGFEEEPSKSVQPETESMDKECNVKSVVEKFKKDLCLKLSLDEKMECESFKCCKFNLIYRSLSHPSNEFEKNNLFLLIHEDEFQQNREKNSLWKEIIRNQQQWPYPLSQDPSETFGVENVLRKSQCKFANLLDKSYELDRSILIVTRNVFESIEKCFQTDLSSKPGSPQKFYFALRTLEEYYVVDPENYSNGFKRQKREVQRLLGKRLQYSEPEECFLQPLGTNTKNIEENKMMNRIQYPRPFKKPAEGKYEYGRTFPQPESGGKLFTRCLEYKAFFSLPKNRRDDRCKLFVKEALRFAAACMNCRKDGTIYFGVADSKGFIDGKMYKHGQIVGMPDMDSDTRNSFTEALENGIKISGFFQSELVHTAFNCICEPQFVEVETPGETESRFVIEVDVQPVSQLCKTFYFQVNLYKIDKKEKDEYVLLERNGASTNTLKKEKERTFISLDLQNFISLRKQFEDELLKLCCSCKKAIEN